MESKRVRVRSSRHHARRRRGYIPTVYTLQQALDSIPNDTDLEKVRAGLRQIVQDEKLWTMLRECRDVSEQARKVAEGIAKKFKAYKFK